MRSMGGSGSEDAGLCQDGGGGPECSASGVSSGFEGFEAKAVTQGVLERGAGITVESRWGCRRVGRAHGWWSGLWQGLWNAARRLTEWGGGL